MVNTHIFNLISGVEAEIKELTGKHQRLITQHVKGKKFDEVLNKILKSILIRIGSDTNINANFIDGMLSEDRKLCLAMARQFSMDFEPELVYTHILPNKKGHEITVPLEEGKFPTVQMENQYSEYADIQRNHILKLNKSGLQVRFILLDGNGEKFMTNTKKSDVSSHTLLKARRVEYFHKEENKEGIWVTVNFDNLGLRDLAQLRKEIKQLEGSVDTEIQFEDPDGEVIKVDILHTKDFFFPAGI